jgi:hypothetical protein
LKKLSSNWSGKHGSENIHTFLLLPWQQEITPPTLFLSSFTFCRSHWYVVLIYRPGNFDPSKVTPITKARSRQRKSSKPRKRVRKPKAPTFDSPEDPGAEDEGVCDVVSTQGLDLLHMNVYNTDEEDGDGGTTRSKVPGEAIAAALSDADTVQQSGNEVRITTKCGPPVIRTLPIIRTFSTCSTEY